MKTAAKDFKMTELGPIPKDWEVKRFDECFDFAAAGDLREECYNRERVGNCVYPIFSNSLTNKGLYGYTSSPRYKADSITITGRGTLGYAEYRGEAFDAIIRLLILTPKQEVDCRFVVDWINHINPFVNESTSIPQLTVPQVAGSWFVFPPLPEQRKIAAALSDVDEMIAALKKLIEKKRKIKTGAMQRLLTGKTRLPGFKGAWVEKRLGDCGGLIRDAENPFEFPNKLFVEYSMPGFDAGKRAVQVVGKSMLSSRTKIHGEVLLFNKLNVRQRRIWYVESCPKDAICSSEFLPYYSDRLNLSFLAYSLTTERSTRHFIDSSSGTSNSQKRISPQVFMDFSVLLPPTIAEQKAIAKVLGDMDEEIAALEAELAKTRQLKQGLMQELLTGRTRLI